MDAFEEARLQRLLQSVEREEIEVVEERPTGSFVRQLFADDNEIDVDIGSSEDDEIEYGIDAMQNEEENATENDSNANDYNDFDDIENLPLVTRKSDDIVHRIDGRIAYISKSRDMLWDTQPTHSRNRGRNILRIRMNCVENIARNAKTPVEVWSLFFTEEMVHNIVQSTNIWIRSDRGNFIRERDARETTPEEIRAVFGILYMAGVMRSSHQILEDLWSTDGFGVEFFRCAMSLKRFKYLLRATRFDDINTRQDRLILDKLAPIRDLFEDFVANCEKNYRLSEFVTIDEMLESFRGRCGFRQFIKSKPAKYGLKVYALTCARSFYTSKLEVYTGRQPEGPFAIDNSGKSVVERMVAGITGSGRNVTVDNYFTSIPLCVDLLKNHRLTMVGTLRKNKKEIPNLFLNTKDRKVGSSIFAFKDECTMVSYVSNKNKNVILLSSMHDDDNLDQNPNSPTFQKPEIILFYNSSKGGVDTVDKYKESYSTARICKRWSMRLFYTLLDVGALNSFIILKSNCQEPNMKRRTFLMQLAKDLCKDFMQSRLSIKSTPTIAKKRICEIMEIEPPRKQIVPPTDEITSSRCFKCDWKKNRLSKTRCSTCKFFMCREHTAPPKCVQCIENNTEMEDENDDV